MENKVYIRQIPDREQFEVSFQFISEQPRLSRQFNFLRKDSESVNTLLNRIQTNLEKYINKKNKKDVKNIEVAMMIKNEQVNVEKTCKEIFEVKDNIVLILDGEKYNVVINPPWVQDAILPRCLLENFPIYFKKLELKYAIEELTEFVWYRSIDLKEWVTVGKGLKYVPTEADVGHFLKVSITPRNANTEGPFVEVLSNVKVLPMVQSFIFNERHKFTENKLKGKEFRIVSYNILADLHCDSDYSKNELFPYTPPYALSIDYRKQLLLKEILGYNADIICLQEMDKKVFQDFQPILSDYEGDLFLKGGEVTEGLACFYRRDRFNKIDSQKILLSKFFEQENQVHLEILAKISENMSLKKKFSNLPTVLSVVTLESKENPKELLVVANTHLYFHPNADNIRLLQGSLIIKFLEDFLRSLRKNTNNEVKLLLCGDFNSSPDCGIYKLYTTGDISDETCVDFYSNPEESISEIRIHHDLKLGSAYGTPKYTNFTGNFAECLDYIFYEVDKMRVTQVVPLPQEEDLRQFTALPSVAFPSDHLALVADIKWI